MTNWKLTLILRAFSLAKVPLLGAIRPKVIELSATRSAVQLPLIFLTKNHLGSMYFGALAMGAELSIALKVVEMNRVGARKVNFIFKDFTCEFHKRAETAVIFSTTETPQIETLVNQALASGERVNGTFSGVAHSAKAQPGDPPLMTYRLTISMKAAK